MTTGSTSNTGVTLLPLTCPQRKRATPEPLQSGMPSEEEKQRLAAAAQNWVEDKMIEREEALTNFISHPTLPSTEEGFDLADISHVLHLILPESDHRDDAIQHITASTPIDEATLI